MEIINSNNLVIANGRKFGDLTGDFTWLKYNGCSVVDFCIASWKLYDCIQNFYVNEFTHLSDHCPVTCTINCNIQLSTL